MSKRTETSCDCCKRVIPPGQYVRGAALTGFDDLCASCTERLSAAIKAEVAIIRAENNVPAESLQHATTNPEDASARGSAAD